MGSRKTKYLSGTVNPENVIMNWIEQKLDGGL